MSNILIAYIAELVICIIVTAMRFKSIITINSLYTITWFIGGMLNLIGFAGMYIASSEIHLFILTSVAVFNIGYIIYGNKNRTKLLLSELKFSVYVNPVILINIIACMYMVPFFIKAVNIVRSSSFYELRKYAFVASDEFATLLESRVLIWVVSPLIFSTILIAVVLFVLGKGNKKLNAISIINMFLYTFILGGKLLVVLSVVLLLFMILIKKIYFSDFKWMKIQKIHIGVLMAIASYLVYTTSLRALHGLDVLENFIVYNYGGISYFDAILKSSEYKELNSVILYGRGAFGFILTPILYFIHHAFSIPSMDGEYITKQITANFLPISDSYRFNSHPTALYYFWRDYNGIFGIIFGTVLLLFLFIRIEQYVFEARNVRSLTLLLFAFLVLFMTTQKYMLFEIQSFMNIFFIFFLTSDYLRYINHFLQKVINVSNDLFKSILNI